ncbi:MAG TPA: hypothetical protein VHZ55_10565 [Bryobacteraceae bacterium]|nr:hypothetical protein [Bryobacteraceae bacterium]
MMAAHQVELKAPKILGAALGILLLAGLWTLLAGAVTAVVEAWIAFSNPGNLLDAARVGDAWGPLGRDWPGRLVPRCTAFWLEADRATPLVGAIGFPLKWTTRLSRSNQPGAQPYRVVVKRR